MAPTALRGDICPLQGYESQVGFGLNQPSEVYVRKSLVGFGSNEPPWDTSLVGLALNRINIAKTTVRRRACSCLNQKRLVGFDFKKPFGDARLVGFALNRLEIAKTMRTPEVPEATYRRAHKKQKGARANSGGSPTSI